MEYESVLKRTSLYYAELRCTMEYLDPNPKVQVFRLPNPDPKVQVQVHVKSPEPEAHYYRVLVRTTES